MVNDEAYHSAIREECAQHNTLQGDYTHCHQDESHQGRVDGLLLCRSARAFNNSLHLTTKTIQSFVVQHWPSGFGWQNTPFGDNSLIGTHRLRMGSEGCGMFGECVHVGDSLCCHFVGINNCCGGVGSTRRMRRTTGRCRCSGSKLNRT